MNRSLLVALAILGAVVVRPAAAQYVSVADQPWSARFSLEPYAGVFFDNAGNSDLGFGGSSFLGGARAGYLVNDVFRLLGDVGYANGEAATLARRGGGPASVGSDRWLLTGGAELDLVPGETSGSIGVQGGVAWRGLADDGGFARSAVVVPGIAVRQRIAPRAEFKVGLQDYIFLDDSPTNHNFALTAGMSFR